MALINSAGKATVIATLTVNINLHKVWRRTGNKELKNYITVSSIVHASTRTFYTCQPFYIYRRDIFYLKSAKIFHRAPIISEDVRRRSEDFRKCYEEFRLTWTQEHY